MSRGAGAPRSGEATGELAQAADNMTYRISRAFGGGDITHMGYPAVPFAVIDAQAKLFKNQAMQRAYACNLGMVTTSLQNPIQIHQPSENYYGIQQRI